jgi:L-seryl-tRNA(Ser) seleniumtransferase
MKKIHAWILVSIAVLIGACASAPSSRPGTQPGSQSGATDLSGSWVLITESRMGAQEAQMTMRQTGNALAGTITGEAGSVDYTGSVSGAAVAFDFTINVQGTDMKFDYTGTVAGDTIKGKAVFGQFGEGSFTAKRK